MKERNIMPEIPFTTTIFFIMGLVLGWFIRSKILFPEDIDAEHVNEVIQKYDDMEKKYHEMHQGYEDMVKQSQKLTEESEKLSAKFNDALSETQDLYHKLQQKEQGGLH
jgi:dsDNA-specific endonuclease/ATPase MutS2